MSSSPRRDANRNRVVLKAENLEDRDVPAGNVSAFVSGGVLQINGDPGDNRIWVMGLGNGMAIVAPLDNTSINGAHAPQILGGIAWAYNIQLGDGNDFLYVSNTSGGSSLFVNMGNGNDGLAVDYARNSGANYFATGTGNDVVSVGMGKLNGFTTFDLGQGSNRMNVGGTEFGGVAFRGGSSMDSLGLLGVKFHSAPITNGLERVYSTLTPVANNDRAVFKSGQSVNINLAANDTAPGNTINRGSIQITRQPANGTVSVNGDGTVTYRAGNSSTATSDRFSYTIRNSSGAESNEAFVSLVLSPSNGPDSASPIPTITNTGGNRTNLASIPFTVTFDEDVTGFELADVAVANGIVSNFVAVNARTYTFNVAPNADGAVTVTLAAGAAKDAANNNSVARSKVVTSDRTPPTITITNGGGDTPNLSVIPYTVTFNEDVTGFDLSDVTVTGGNASNFVAVNARTYQFNVTPTVEGNVTVSIAANAAKDLANNDSPAASRTVISGIPTIAVTTTASAANPNLIPVTVTFSENVTGFVEGDVVVTGGTISAFTAVNARTYTFTVTPDGSGDQIKINIAAGVAQDATGHDNLVANEFTSIAVRTDAGMTDTQPAANAPEWQTTASGLKKWVIQAGTGPAVVSTSNLGVFYTGWLLNGTVFDSGRTDGSPVLFPLTNLIAGWKEGLLGMQPGGILRLYVPANLAYGSAGQGNVPPNADLIFELKLVSLT